MRIPWAAALLALSSLGCSFGCSGSLSYNSPGAGKPPSSVADSVDRMERLTVALVHPNPPTPSDPHALPDVYCAGVWVGHSTVLTAKHCADDGGVDPIELLMHALDPSVPLKGCKIGTQLSVVTRDQWHDNPKVLDAKVVAFDGGNDLALLKVSLGLFDSHPQVEVADYDPQPGSPIFVEGHTEGLPWSYSQGWVSSERIRIDGPEGRVGDEMQAVVPGFYYGNSGGPAFDGAGKLVGIAVFINDAPGSAFFEPVHVLREFLYH